MEILNLYDKVQEELVSYIECESPPSEVKELSIAQLNKLFFIYRNNNKERTYERDERINKFKTLYLGIVDLPFDKKIDAILMWRRVDVTFDAVLNKGILLEYINKDNVYHESIYRMIEGKKLKFNREDVKKIDEPFIKFVMEMVKGSRSERFKNIDNVVDDNEDDVVHCIKSSNIEQLVINLIMENENADMTNDLLKCLVSISHPRLNLFPCGTVTKFIDERVLKCPNGYVAQFKGELINDITEFYTNTQISPLVEFRRTICLVVDNCVYNHYDYNEYMNVNNRICTNTLCIEFPYMCYAYVSKIVITIAEDYVGGRVKKFTCGYGTEYALVINTEVKTIETSQYDDTRKVREIILKNDNPKNPCSFLDLYSSDVVTIFDIKVYGEAFTLI